IKSHGSADTYAFEWALQDACDAVASGLLARTAQTIAQITSVPAGGAEHGVGLEPSPHGDIA
ncbi:MAG: phosphate acyltransferase, partial [Achromobacter sp.]|nr:phosphate acyltransferase [Achromobacter sp.]